jgi:uroporphyrinogen III methyltransferase/synthase
MAVLEIIGAGPGDPDLLTIAAVQRLSRAERVFVDAEVRDAVAPHVFEGARVEIVDAGAAPLAHVAQMLDAVREGRRVARAVLGDPLFLGRIRGEIEQIAAAGVAYELVAGVPDLVGAATAAGLALEAPLRIEAPSGAAPRALETRVSIGVTPDAHDGPTASVPWPPRRGARPSVEESSAAHPAPEARALRVSGPAASAAPPFGWLSGRPLFGRVVAITRAATQAGETARAVRARGGLPLEAPTISIEPPEAPARLAAAARAIGSYDLIAFTSANGVDALFAAIREVGLDARALAGALVAVIGPGTGRALAPYGVRADLAAEEHRGEGLAAAITQRLGGSVAGKRVLLARAAVARDALPDTLRHGGAHVDVVPAYRSLPAPAAALAPLREALLAGEVDVVTFTASSTATNFCQAFPDAEALLARTVVASIGPITSDTLRARGLRVDVEASPYTIPSLLDAIEAHFAARG